MRDLEGIIKTPDTPTDHLSAWHLYVININFDRLKINRETLIQKLYKQNIITQVHYIPTFNQPIYKNFSKRKFKNAKEYFESCLSLPIFYDLSGTAVKKIVKKLKNILI